TGRGQLVDTSLFEAGLALSAWEATEYWFTGQIPRGLGTAHRLNAPYQAFRASDGHFTVGAANNNLFPALLRAARPRPPREGPALRHGGAPPAEPRGARAADRGGDIEAAASSLAGQGRGARAAGRAQRTASPKRSPPRTRGPATWSRSYRIPRWDACRVWAIP